MIMIRIDTILKHDEIELSKWYMKMHWRQSHSLDRCEQAIKNFKISFKPITFRQKLSYLVDTPQPKLCKETLVHDRPYDICQDNNDLVRYEFISNLKMFKIPCVGNMA